VSESAPAASRLPRWRVAVGCAVLGLLVVISARLAPSYLRNYQLQQFVEETTQRVANQTASDDVLRTQIVEKAAELDLPIKADNVLVKRTAGGLRIDVRYAVRVDLPLYTVSLHFYPGAEK